MSSPGKTVVPRGCAPPRLAGDMCIHSGLWHSRRSAELWTIVWNFQDISGGFTGQPNGYPLTN